MWDIYTVHETFLTVFLGTDNKNVLGNYHWTLNLEIIEHTEIVIEYQWNETFDYVLCSLFVADTYIDW